MGRRAMVVSGLAVVVAACGDAETLPGKPDAPVAGAPIADAPIADGYIFPETRDGPPFGQ